MDANIPVPSTLRKGTSVYATWVKGYKACMAGELKDTCPYEPSSYTCRHFYNKWRNGWDTANEEK